METRKHALQHERTPNTGGEEKKAADSRGAAGSFSGDEKQVLLLGPKRVGPFQLDGDLMLKGLQGESGGFGEDIMKP
jgi:hypothetical protein